MLATPGTFGTFDVLTAGLLLALVGTAAVHDLRSHRIPNRLVATGAIAAWLLQMALHGAGNGTWLWATGLAAGLAPFVLLYVAGAVGAGDAKLMGCVGACAGAARVPELLLATLLCGGALAIGTMFVRRRVRHTFSAMLGALLWLPFGMAGAHGNTHAANTHATNTKAAQSADVQATDVHPDAATRGQGRASADSGGPGGATRLRTTMRLPYAVAIGGGVLLVMTGVV
ncbi:Precorrin-2 dehydrogenase [Cupriavidus sp. H19C3]|uniref:A24 family peptidase n=1 Tax=Cupriavidus sp. H19C3 TaxID=3241603 RepID=UPI003BF79710